MHMWGEMMPKRGCLEFLANIFNDALGLLANEADYMFIIVSCPYTRMDWDTAPTSYSHRSSRKMIVVIIFFSLN